MRRTCESLGATLAAAVLAACGSLLPEKVAERLATLQFLSSGDGSECVILRAHGDRVVLFVLDGEPRLDGIPDYLKARGLAGADDVVFLASPTTPPRFPSGAAWRRVHCARGAEAVLREALAVAAAGGGPSIQLEVVTGPKSLDIPGLDLELAPCAGPAVASPGGGAPPGAGLLADLRHAGNRVVLLPVAEIAPQEVRDALAGERVDLVGLLPAGRLAALRELPGLKDSKVVVRSGTPLAAGETALLLAGRERLLIRSAADGLTVLRSGGFEDS